MQKVWKGKRVAERRDYYIGKLLRVNLEDESSKVEEIDPAILRSFIGGRGLGAYLLYREVGPEADPLGPENKLIFVVDRRSTKPEIKKAIEKMFKVKVLKVSTFITPAGEKRAYIKFDEESPAIDIATQLGLM